MFENHAINLFNRQLSWLTASLTCLRAFLRAFTRFQGYTVQGYTVQGYTVFKFYPLSLRYRDPAASPLNARQYMFENQAIKLINRQLSWLTGSLTCLRACTRFYALLRAFISVKQFTPFTVYSLQFTPFGI